VILVDTSVWIEFLRGGTVAEQLKVKLDRGDLVVHPFVRGELALGQLGKKHAVFLRGIDALPFVDVAPHDVVLGMVEAHALAASGVGWVDAHLLAACVGAGARLWTLDRSLRLAALRIRKPGILDLR
jgi:predicted nucleic acid-binding protein